MKNYYSYSWGLLIVSMTGTNKADATEAAFAGKSVFPQGEKKKRMPNTSPEQAI